MAVEITMSSIKTQVVFFRNKFEVKQHDKVFCKQQSLGLRLENLFPKKEIIEEYSALHYRTDFIFKKHMLTVEICEKGHAGRDPDYEKKHENIFKRLLTTLLELILINWILMIIKNLVKQILTLLNKLKNKPKS